MSIPIWDSWETLVAGLVPPPRATVPFWDSWDDECNDHDAPPISAPPGLIPARPLSADAIPFDPSPQQHLIENKCDAQTNHNDVIVDDANRTTIDGNEATFNVDAGDEDDVTYSYVMEIPPRPPRGYTAPPCKGGDGCKNVAAWQCPDGKCMQHCTSLTCPRHNSDYATRVREMLRWQRAERRRGGTKRARSRAHRMGLGATANDASSSSTMGSCAQFQ